MTQYGTVFSVDGDPGEVTHMLVGAGKLVEERSLAAVLVAHQGKGYKGAVGQRIAASFGMETSVFTKSQVFQRNLHRF